ncbi:MAG TPA: class I SAM-dependent methyltransferase [Xanthobacteraceae bacterium]|nr:class I SAM-dependent methyltransferase [Xanthobacteraceae bacterium]
MSFSATWLRLREPVDHRSRDRALLAKTAALLANKAEPVIYDLGAGAGSNLRGTALALGPRQRWVLVDYDADLLAASLEFISAWADKTRPTAAGLEVEKAEKRIRVEVKRADLNANPAPWGTQKPDLVTSAALFDLVSEAWIARFCASLVSDRLPLYTTLVHDETAQWAPAHAADARMMEAFERDFGKEKGFGPSAGNRAIGFMAKTLASLGYQTELADSPWRLAEEDHDLIVQLADGWANAVRETGSVPEDVVQSWLSARKTGGSACVVGHKDLLALPVA